MEANGIGGNRARSNSASSNLSPVSSSAQPSESNSSPRNAATAVSFDLPNVCQDWQ